MAGKWQRDFFLITEDPFAVDFSTLELWVEGYSVREAAELRWNGDVVSTVKQPRGPDKFSRGVTTTPSPPSASAISAVSDHAGGRMSLIAGDPTFHLRLQFMDLLRQDCAQQYEAFEFLEDALADPLHFLEFCPVQLELPARRLFIERYYSLDSKCLRELLRNSNVLNIKLQGGGDRKAVAEVEGMARTSGERSLKVARILMNLQRACRWVEQAAAQRVSTGGNTWSAHQSRSQLINPANICYPWARLAIPELEALGEPLCWRYRSLAFVLLHRFDFSSKTLHTLRSEHIEDVAALILACGSLPGSGFPGMLDVLVGGDHESSSSHLSDRNLERSGQGTAASLRQDSVFDPIVREGLRQLDLKVLRPKFNDFKTLVLQHFENRPAELTSVAGFQGAAPAVPPVQSEEPSRAGSFAAVSVGRSVFSRFVRMKTARLETVIHALSTCLVCLQSPSEFSIFFNILADFVDRLQSVDSAEPLEMFQVCYSAMEQIAEKEQAEVRKAVWPHWLQCWRTFLEFFRATTACALREQAASPQVQSKQEKENPNYELTATSNASLDASGRNVSLVTSSSLDTEATPPAERRMYLSL